MNDFPAHANALVQGASGGLGQAITKKLLADVRFDHIFATSRDPENCTGLVELRERRRERLSLVRLDVTRETDAERAAEHVAEKLEHLHLLINVTGILHDSEGMFPEKRLEDVQPHNLQRSFAVNAVGPLLMAKHFYPLLRHHQRAVFASLSARVGSIEDNRRGGWYAYRAAKAAQNQFTRTLAIELQRRVGNCICLALHPGTVDTGLSRPFQRNVPSDKLFSRAFAADCLLKIIFDASIEDSGSFFSWDGQKIPW